MNESCKTCKYCLQDDDYLECGLDNQPIKQPEGICTAYEDNGLIPEFPEHVLEWMAKHPSKDAESQSSRGQGIKNDSNKPRLAEMIQDFAPELEELCKVWEYGANKYSKSNWKLVAGGEERYLNALIRHLVAPQATGNLCDSESGLLHAAHMVFNSLAYLHFILKDIRGNNGTK